MLTLTDHPDNVAVCDVVKGKRLQYKVQWHPRRDESLQNEVESLASFNTPYLRDMFEISKEQADSIFDHLQRGETDPTNQKAFFKVKKYINSSLFTEMNLENTDLKFEIRFDKDNEKYSGHEMFIGGTGSGKTTACLLRILRNLNGPKSQRRRFLVFSAQYEMDKTLKPLRSMKYESYVTGVDCGEAAYKESVHETEEDFFLNEIKHKVDNAPPGTVVVFDDAREIVGSNMVRHLIDKLLRVGRHFGLTLQVILHSLKSGVWSSQAYSSIKYLTTFPRSQKAKIINFLNKDLGLSLPVARDHVFAFSQTGRTMTVRFHAPEMLIGDKLIRLL